MSGSELSINYLVCLLKSKDQHSSRYMGYLAHFSAPSPKNTPEKVFHLGWFTYGVHEKCPVLKLPHPLVHLSPKFFHSLDLGPPISNELWNKQNMEQQPHRACEHSQKKRKDSQETWAELTVLRSYVENHAILEPILYRASKCKQTKEQGNGECLWTHILTFL